MEIWRMAWRKGVAPLLSRDELSCLAAALSADDPRLIQGATTHPLPLDACDRPRRAVEAACPLGYCGWQTGDLLCVSEVEEYFAAICYEIDLRLGERGGCRWFLNFVDETPRPQMLRELLREVELALVRYGG